MHSVMVSLLNFASKTKNIYGFHIERTTFTDTILAATRFSTSTYPAIEIIYNAVNWLKKKIRDEGAIEKYMDDHFLSAPAIPFEILITDRNKEADTSKWETKIFYPSM